MKNTLQRIGAFGSKLWRDEQGAEGLEKMLIIAAVVLPLLAILIYFKEYLSDWLGNSADNVRRDSDFNSQSDPF